MTLKLKQMIENKQVFQQGVDGAVQSNFPVTAILTIQKKMNLKSR